MLHIEEPKIIQNNKSINPQSLETYYKPISALILCRENLKIVGGAVELDWMWLCRRFEVGLEEKKLKSGAAELDWKRMIG